jgi:hypothetical protein
MILFIVSCVPQYNRVFFRSQAMHSTDPFHGDPSSAESTAPFQSAPKSKKVHSPRMPMALVGPSGTSPTEELRDLLRKRMRILCLIGLCVTLVAVVVVFPGALATGYWQLIVIYSTCLITAVVSTALLYSGLRLSLRVLRAGEFIILAVLVVLLVWYILHRSLDARDAAFFAALGEHPCQVQLVPASGESSKPHLWKFELGDYAMHYFGGHYNLFWFGLIFGYALYFPNTWQRCALVVGSLGLLAIGLNGVIVWCDAAVRGSILPALFWQSASWIGIAASLAIFGAYRIESTRQEAAKARKLGQYRLKELLGAGGMGEVHLAEHVLLRRPCAIKLIRPERAGDPKNLARFEREVQATATLTNWHTVEIFDFGRAADGAFYYVMEYLPGLNLEQLVRLHGPLPPPRAVHLLRQVCSALHEAHGIGLIHRDLKPSNIITCRRGGMNDVAKLLDFGLVLDRRPEGDWEKLTQEGVLTGTPSYMSPEQAANVESLDARSDIYSLGAVAYFLLAGRPPFTARSAVAVLASHLHERPKGLQEILPECPPDVEAVVLRCLEKEPQRRFPDVASLARALEGCQCAGAWTESRAREWWEINKMTATVMN